MSNSNPALRNPSQADQEAPQRFTARVETTQGDFKIDVHRQWAPRGADRFYNLIKIGFFEDIALFRVISGFMAQFGIHGDPSVSSAWRDARIKDDPVKKSNTRGRISFATSGPNSRTTQLFINFGDNSGLDGQGFAPFGEVSEGMRVVDSIYKGYGEGAPHGAGPDQMRIQSRGNPYLKKDFPKLDYIKKVEIVDEDSD
ncbi:MAG TPA: peptidylprolyl isomerase [Acidobacteriota bacterium]|nr:peptidylprolyl isomerase [Acidobacteriota bacterium]